MKIAIVEDSAFMRGLIARTLRRIVPDAELHEFADPVQALKLMPALAPELITLDLLMPGLSGLEFLRRIKRKKLAVRVVVVTADVQASIRKKCAAAGAYGFVEKPVTVAKLRAALAGGLRARLHVGQFADVGGAALAASLGAASADHLEHLSDDGARALGAAGVVGVLLPGAALSLGQPMPDARRLRDLGMDLALGTDCNPGTSHTDALPLMATLAVRQMGLSTPEAWHAITRVAARSLDLPDRGVIRPGARADLAVLDLGSWEALPYTFGGPRARHVVLGGRAFAIPC